MRLRLKNMTLHHYIRYMRRQSKHVQHIHAVAFAGIITVLIAAFLLYTEYGFWHETYRREETVAAPEEPVTLGGAFGRFIGETRSQFNAIGDKGADLFEGKETYKKEGE